jgi:chemotaxis phosphatase CheX-like protein
MSRTPNVIPIEEWLTTLRAASAELAKHSLRFDPQPAPAASEEPGEPGAYIAVLSPHNAVHLGLSATPARCRALARALLGLRHNEPLTEHDVVDGLSEVMNILAGKVKASMAGRDGQLHLGLPMFVANPIRSGGDSEATSAQVRLGPVECTLRVYRRQRAA